MSCFLLYPDWERELSYIAPFILGFFFVPIGVFLFYLCTRIFFHLYCFVKGKEKFSYKILVVGLLIYMETQSRMCFDFAHKILSAINAENSLSSVVSGILAGVIASFIYAFLVKVPEKIRGYTYRKIFGKDHWDDYKLICGEVFLLVAGINTYKGGHRFCVPQAIPTSEVIAANYLKTSIATNLAKNGNITTDSSISQASSFCSFGGMNNTFSQMVLSSRRNVFYDLGTNKSGAYDKFVRKTDSKVFAPPNNTNVDYGIIVKIKDQNSDSVQICAIGLGHAGTRGAAYYLAYKWKELVKKVGRREFGCVVKVMRGNDMSVELVDCLVGNE